MRYAVKLLYIPIEVGSLHTMFVRLDTDEEVDRELDLYATKDGGRSKNHPADVADFFNQAALAHGLDMPTVTALMCRADPHTQAHAKLLAWLTRFFHAVRIRYVLMGVVVPADRAYPPQAGEETGPTDEGG